MAHSASTVNAIAQRYASALFELAITDGKLAEVEKDLGRFEAVFAGSEDLQRVATSPLFSEDDQFRAIDEILNKAKISGLVGNFIRVLTKNGRLFSAEAVFEAFRNLVARHNGEAVAEVTVAHELDAAQTKELQAALKSVVGKDVSIDAKVDPSILGGMIVKVGSRQIDTSIKTKLSSLKLALT